jgi:phenylacetate-CoA ligase
MTHDQPFLSALRQKLHCAAYLSLQALRRRPVAAHMRLLDQWDRLAPADYQALCRKRLHDALAYAKLNVPAYSTGRWTSARAKDLNTWPILDRQFLQQHPDALNTMTGQKLVYRRSSASTAKPVVVAWDPPAAAWAWGNEYHGLSWHHLPIASSTLILWGREEPIVNCILNRTSFYHTGHFTADELDRAARRLIQQRPRLLWAMPSSAAQLARHIGHNYPHAPQPLVQFAKIGGEQVFPFQRDEIERYLGARIIEVYGCSEMGCVALECPRGAKHIFATAAHVEILREGQPAQPGEVGDLVITSLVNRAMPLVRYRNGDRASLSPHPCPCGLPHPILANLQSRDADLLYTCDGRQIHGSQIGHALEQYVGLPGLGSVRLIRFEQTDLHTWNVLAESDDPVTPTLRQQATHLVRSLFGQKCTVHVQTLRFLPREPSGKFRYYKTIAPTQRPAACPDDVHAASKPPATRPVQIATSMQATIETASPAIFSPNHAADM